MSRLALSLSLAVLAASTALADPFAIEPIAEVTGLRRSAADFVLRGKTLFVLTAGKSELVVSDLQDPRAPVRLFKGYYEDLNLELLAVDEVGVVYAVGRNGFAVFDARRPERTKLLGVHTVVGTAGGGDKRFVRQQSGELILRKDRLYVASSTNSLLCIDVSNPTTPILLGEVRAKSKVGFSRGVRHLSGTRMLAYDGVGIGILDVADPTRVRVPTVADANYVVVEGGSVALEDLVVTAERRYVYACAADTIYTIDLEQSKVVATLPLAEKLQPRTALKHLSLSPDERVLMAGATTGVVAINVVDPLNPRFEERFGAPGCIRSRIYGDVFLARGYGYNLTISQIRGTESVGTVGGTTTDRDNGEKHASKRPELRPSKKGKAKDKDGPQEYTVRWRAVRRPGRGSYTTYTVAYRAYNSVVWHPETVEVVGKRAKHTFTGLEPNMIYMARCRTVLEDGEFSPWSPLHQFLMPSPVPTWAEEWSTDVTPTSITLNWSVPKGSEKAFMAFYMFYRAQGGQWKMTEMREPGVFKGTIEDLKPKTVYQVRVRGVYGPLNVSPLTEVKALVTKKE